MTVSKQDKRKNGWEDESLSILNTNSTKMTEEEKAAKDEKPVAKPKLKNVLAAVLVVVILVGIFVGGGLISEAQYQAQLKKEAAQALREGFTKCYYEEPVAEKGELEFSITQAYYSQENGMWMTLTVANAQDKAAVFRKVGVVVKDEESEKEIVNGSSALKKWVVEAGETKQLSIYFPPEFVKVTDHTLEKALFETTVDYDTEND